MPIAAVRGRGVLPVRSRCRDPTMRAMRPFTSREPPRAHAAAPPHASRPVGQYANQRPKDLFSRSCVPCPVPPSTQSRHAPVAQQASSESHGRTLNLDWLCLLGPAYLALLALLALPALLGRPMAQL